MRRDRNHPYVKDVAHQAGIGYDEAEEKVRDLARRDPKAKKAVEDIDTLRASNKAEALELNATMAKRLGFDLDGAARLVALLAGDTVLETWLIRRVNLYRANDAPEPNDDHPTDVGPDE